MISEVTKKDIDIQRISVEQLLRAKYGSSFDADKLRYEIDTFHSWLHGATNMIWSVILK
jgi:hypothetical protein